MAGESILNSAATDTYKSLLTTTLMRVLESGAVADNVFNNDVLLQFLRDKGRIKVVDGGERLRVGIMHEKNTTAGWYSDYEALNVTPSEGFTTAFYNWKQGSTSVSVSGKELRSNKGPSRLSSLQEEKITQAVLSLADLVATGAYSDGTGTAGKQLTGLEAMIETTPGTTAYASIPTTNTAWRNQVQTSVGSAATNLLPKMRTLWNSCSQGKGGAKSSPTGIFTTQTVHEALESLIFTNIRYARTGTEASGHDAGVGKLMFKGAVVEWDAYVPSGTLYMINTNFMYLFVHSDANFAMADGGFQKPINQDALVTQILVQGNLATNNRRKNGKLTGIT